MDGCDRRDEWSLVVLIPAWRSSGLGRTQGEARTGLQKHRMVTAITSGSEPGSYICPVSALHLSLTMTCVLSLKSHEQRKKSCGFFPLLFPAFCLAWCDVGLISTKCWVRSVLVLCWQGCHVLPFCSDTLPTNHVCPLKFEVSTVCISFCISILSLCNLLCDHAQASAPAWDCWTDSRQECVFLLSLLSCALTEKLLSMLLLCQRCLGA